LNPWSTFQNSIQASADSIHPVCIFVVNYIVQDDQVLEQLYKQGTPGKDYEMSICNASLFSCKIGKCIIIPNHAAYVRMEANILIPRKMQSYRIEDASKNLLIKTWDGHNKNYYANDDIDIIRIVTDNDELSDDMFPRLKISTKEPEILSPVVGVGCWLGYNSNTAFYPAYVTWISPNGDYFGCNINGIKSNSGMHVVDEEGLLGIAVAILSNGTILCINARRVQCVFDGDISPKVNFKDQGLADATLINKHSRKISPWKVDMSPCLIPHDVNYRNYNPNRIEMKPELLCKDKN
jgi:hypothetical protein